jgi:ABC-type transport system involved in multi-copper enzyme maturation permease subunit
MIEAVVRLEWLLRARRDGFRSLLSFYFVCLLLDCCALYYGVIGDIFLPPSPSRSGRLLAAAVEFLWIQQWLLPLLLAPPFVANAFAAEKASGVLPLLLITSLTSGEIILGKFIARTVPLMLLGLAHLPFWGLIAGLVGIDLWSMCVLAGGSLLPILGASAVSLLASVCCRKTADAVVAAYAVFGLLILSSWAVESATTSICPGSVSLAILQNGLQPFGPSFLLEPLWDGRLELLEAGSRVLIASAAWGMVVIGCLGLACWRLKPGSTNRSETRRARLRSRRPLVGDEPICWKERYRERRMPLALFRNIPTWLALLGIFMGTWCLVLWSFCPIGTDFAELVECLRAGDLYRLGSHLGTGAPPARPVVALVLMIGMLILAALTVGVRCATAVSGERENHTWELLLLTPLSTQELVQGKVRGILRSTLPYVASYALAAVPLAWLAGSAEVLITLLAVLISAPTLWLAGAVGINQSVRCDNTWQSILATVRLIIGGTFLTIFVSNFVLGFLALIVLGLGILPGHLRLLLSLLILGSFWGLAYRQGSREYLAKAEKWIDDCERGLGATIKSTDLP